ncbi:DNA mismatch repair protein Mlh3-like [Hetaerina americana]|uniref:DNA mismatch repair protein Mlh3-like n=1 Tax=Hetaerina americana TaxID=62018 RepID=UPI003A7F2C19
MAIQKLPEEVKSAVRSGIAISSSAQCITELVMNSLDAGASSIVIHLDFPHFKLEVDDNGHGITFDNLHHVGIRYHTSKCRTMEDLKNNLKYNGYRGEALASLSESCGFLVIVTRPKNTESDKTYLKAFTRGRPQKPIETSAGKSSHGTTVTVQDFMCHAPVRQKRIIPNVDVEEIRIQVEGIALSHPHVSFTIINDSDNSVVCRISSASSSLETFTQLYGLENSKNLSPIGPLTSGKLNISGYISTSSYHNKRLQFIFVNGRLVKGTKIHKLINMIMRKSDVLRGNGPWQELPMPDRMRDFLWVSPMKKRDRYCVFLVYISCPISDYDITLDPKKTLIEFCDWDTMFECMENAVKSFLKEHNLACIAPDQEITNNQSSGDSPSSVINEMDQLEKEDSLGQKLNHFRCPVEVHGGHGKALTSGNSILNMKTAIHSIPAKRNLHNVLDSSKLQEQHTSKEKAAEKVGNSVKYGNSSNETRVVRTKCVTDKLAEVTSADKVALITFPLIQEDNPTPVNSLNEFNHFNVRSTVQDSGSGSLGRFRKSFQKTQVNSLQTPDDIQKIVVKEPPPIIRRQAPLEHRIKGCISSKKCINTGVNTEITVGNATKNTDINKKEASLSKHLMEFAFDRSILKDPGMRTNLIQSKNVKSDDPVTSYNSLSGRSVIVSIATQTESNVVSDGVCKETHGEGVLRPNLKNLNLLRRQFQETKSHDNRIKVCKYNHVNRNPENSMGIKANINNLKSQSDLLQCENNEMSKLRFVASECMFQRQPHTKSDYKGTIGKIDTAEQHETNSVNKPNFKSLALRRKHFEEAMDCNSTAVHNCDDFNPAAKQNIYFTNTHCNSQKTLDHVLNDISLAEKSNEVEEQNNSMSKKILTSEDFICSLEVGKECQGGGVSKSGDGVRKDISDRFNVAPSQCYGSTHDSVNADSERMPVLEPYYNSSCNSASEQFSFSDSPPSLLKNDYNSHPLGEKLQLTSLPPSKKLEAQGDEKMLSNICAGDQNPGRCDDLSQRTDQPRKINFEKLKGYSSINLGVRDSSFLNFPTANSAKVCCENNSTKVHSLVPMYNSDSEDDADNEVHAMDEVAENSGSLSCSENCGGDEILATTETHITESNFFPQKSYLNIEGFADSAIENASKVCNDQISFGDNSDIILQRKTNPVDYDNHLDFNQEKFVQNDNPNSLTNCSPSTSHDQPLEYFLPQEGERFVSNGDAPIRKLSNTSVAGNGKERSPFFADSSEWDAALSEMCNEVENNDRVNLIEFQPETASYLNVDQQQENRFEMFSRPAFCPKGLSPVMPANSVQHARDNNDLCHVLSSQEGNCLHSIIKQNFMPSDELSWIKWSKNEVNGSQKVFPCRTASTPGNDSRDVLASLLAEAQGKKLISETEILSARVENQSKTFVTVFNLIQPCTFSKEVLSHVKMIGKLDCKFIVAKVSLGNEKVSNTIVLFDQHAVHERIRLERLTKEYQITDQVACENSKGYSKYKSAPVVPSFEITLSTSEARLLDSFQEHFKRLGLVFDVHNCNDNGSGDVIIKINEVPACLLSKDQKESGPLGLKEQVHSLIREQVEHLLVTRGIGILSPNTLRDAVNMKACRGAVKFGDSLSIKECRWLLRKLSACDTPFQCAHGRPSMYPIIELKQINRFYSKNEEDSKPRLWRLKKMLVNATSHQKKL